MSILMKLQKNEQRLSETKKYSVKVHNSRSQIRLLQQTVYEITTGILSQLSSSMTTMMEIRYYF